MKQSNINKICKIERILFAIVMFIGFCLIEFNADVGTAIILFGIFLIIVLPKLTIKIFAKENTTQVFQNKIENNSNINKTNEVFEKSEDNIELKVEHEISEINYEFPMPELLSDDKEIREIIESKEYIDAESKTVVGLKEELNTKIIDLQETSHILIAGTTGIGKTTLLDNIIIDIIYKSKPDETKFIMFDTSNNSLRTYNGIPHLLIPVITDAKKSVGALAWIVQEIENRNKIFLSNNIEDITGFNKKMESYNKGKLPTIIVVIDEVSDIVNIDKEDVDEYLTRITKQGKKAGVFLILSTNRPSTDIVSGSIKANIYTRMSFFLPARLDSKLILDMDGAEKLKNHGDILFKTIGITTPQKYHCPYISTNGIKKVVNFLKGSSNNNYQTEILDKIENSNQFDIDNEADPLLEDAIEIVIETGQASTSFIQRRFKVGYARSGKIIDQMEERGIISGYQGSKPREVLMTKERWEELKNKSNI